MSAERALVLVVDDDPGILTTVADLLDLEGYRVRTAKNGREALELLETITPAVIVLDMRMPELDGWGLADALRERGTRTRVLVMSAAKNAREWADQIHADAVLPKPFELDDLLGALRTLSSSR